MKIVTILGARPQFIKASMVSMEIAKHSEIQEVIVHTGQHFDENMSRIFFNEMEMPEPDYNLGISNLMHGAMTGRMLEKIEQVLIYEQPDWVLVYGDTNSTLAGALAATKLHIPVAHVEAGLRSYNMDMPEEINRILTDRISSILFCPTDRAVANLKREGFDIESVRIIHCGDVMLDAVLHFGPHAQLHSTILRDLKLDEQSYVLCTIHRQENTDDLDRLKSIVEALNRINHKSRVVMPLHPRTKQILEKEGLQLNFEPIDPVGYLDILQLIKDCQFVLTDSGGLQKEAFFFKKHCVTLRNETEWGELVNHGFNSLVRASVQEILGSIKLLHKKLSDFNVDLYGNGNTREIIVDSLIE